MRSGFVGRSAELGRLSAILSRVGDSARDLPGIAVLLRGRRRVGKSRLVEVFCERSGVPFVFFQASQGASSSAGREVFAEAVRWSDLPDRELFPQDAAWPTWSAFFRQLAAALPADRPSIVVMDELPWLLESDPALEGELQTAWDRFLSRKPVLLILIGSDLAMMERLDDYKRPFHQRATVMVLPPLNPAEVGDLLGCGPADALDAYLVTGGLPLICQEWQHGQSLREFLRIALLDPTSALLVSGERSLAAEFPAEVQARDVLTAIGNGARTWKGIQTELTDDDGRQIADSSLANALRRLEAKRVVAVDVPLSAKSGERDKRYRVADPYLRFYLTFLNKGLPLVERGRGDLLMLAIERSWGPWRGRAVEPVIHDALFRIAPNLGFPEAAAVGAWWNRLNNPEIDIVAKNDGRHAHIAFAGSIKWHETQPFGLREYNALVKDVHAVPGVSGQTLLLAVTRTGEIADGVPIRSLGPAELLAAWPPPARTVRDDQGCCPL
jgi:AAA+ ATPase superfamily predicted ATPase